MSFFFSSRRRHTRSVSAFLLNRSSDLVSFPLSAADLPPSPTKSSNLSETAEVPACNVPSRSPLPALAIAPETKLGTASSGLEKPFFVPFGAVVYSVINIKLGEHIVALCQFIH